MIQGKAERIAKYTGKGVEWCAKKLYEARRELEAVRGQKNMYQQEAWKDRAECDEIETLKKINARMAKILEQNGIRPVRLRITYLACDCEHCENNGNIYGEDAWDCYGCGEEINGHIYREKEIRVITTEPFYSYELAGNKLAGITGLFEAKEHNEVIKVIDMGTNEVLYEAPESDGEQS